MNQQERDQLSHFLTQLVEFKLTQKDAEAESLIREAIHRQPDAAYLLVQRSLLLEQAVNTAQTRIQELQNQLQQQNAAASAGSFLGNDPWAQPANYSKPVPGIANEPIPAAMSGGNAAFNRAVPQNMGAGLGSSFLGNIATTAAGVVAGSFLFQGIENLMGGGHHSPGLAQHPVDDKAGENTVINNYYGDDAAPQTAAHNDYLASDDSDFFSDSNDNTDSDWI